MTLLLMDYWGAQGSLPGSLPVQRIGQVKNQHQQGFMFIKGIQGKKKVLLKEIVSRVSVGQLRQEDICPAECGVAGDQLRAAARLMAAIFYTPIPMSDLGCPIKDLLGLVPEKLKSAFSDRCQVQGLEVVLCVCPGLLDRLCLFAQHFAVP